MSEEEQEVSENGAATIELTEESEELVDSFKSLEDDQRREVLLRVIGDSSVLWISDVVDTMEDRFNISTSAPAVAPGAAAGGGEDEEEEEEEKAIHDVELEDFGDNKIKVIKAVRSLTDLGLKEAKSMVDGAPSTVKESVPTEEAEEMKEEIEEAGGTVELK